MPYHSETYACYVDESGAIMRAPICLHTKQRDYSRAKPFKPPMLAVVVSHEYCRRCHRSHNGGHKKETVHHVTYTRS